MSYKLSDTVIARIAQILQEGILLGVDIVDILRQLEVEPGVDGTSLQLTAEYTKRVIESHRALEAQARELQNKSKTILTD